MCLFSHVLLLLVQLGHGIFDPQHTNFFVQYGTHLFRTLRDFLFILFDLIQSLLGFHTCFCNLSIFAFKPM